MRFSQASLGLKLNLALLVFFIILGAATAAFVFAGFNRTRDNASARSEEALQDFGTDVLQYIAYSQADVGATAMEWAQELGHRASRYLEQFKESGAIAPLDIARFVQASNGVWYDPDPGRVSDVVVLNHTTLDGAAALDDIAYSAALDALFPSLMGGFPGELSGEAYYPITIVFVGANSVGRTYPPLSGIEITVPQDFDAAAFINKFGPASNPERRTIWTTPYEDRLGKGLVITAQTPVYQGDTFRGIFEVDLSIDRLTESIDAVKPTRSGFAFYVDREGGILHTGAFDLLTEEMDAGNEVLRGVVERMKDGQPGVDRVFLGGREFFVASAPMMGVGGGFAVVAPISELTENAAAITAGIDEQADRTMLLVLGSMTALFAVALVGATYLNRRVLLQPIEAMVSATRAVADGDLDVSLPAAGKDELATLAASFNQMTSDLRERRDALQREVADRQAAQNELAALFTAMSDVVIVFDANGRCLRIAPTNPDLLYAPPEDVVGRRLDEIMPPDQASLFVDAIQAALRDGTTKTIEYPLKIQQRDYWFAATISPMTADSVVYVARDITERISARQELERQVEERTRELTALLEVSRNVASMLELSPLLDLIIAQVESVADYDRGSLYLLEGDSLRLLASRVRNPNVAAPPSSHQFQTQDMGPVWQRLSGGQSVIIADLQVEDETTSHLRRALGPELDRAVSGIHAMLAVPLALSDRVVGMLSLNHEQPGFYGEHHVQLVSAIAAQAAVAIENARLYEQAQQLAAVEERQRLARELHDSVSQALYGIALGARTARTLLDTDASRATEPMDFVLQLAEAGLAEMRALIFELRPESLSVEGLVAALEKQTAATRARYGIEVTAVLGEEPALSLAEKEVFYRVTQEALNNVVKHAHASQVVVRLSSEGGSVVLEVGDNGAGFDTTASFPGHIGLMSMNERASKIGARLEVESAIGRGTTVRLTLRSGQSVR